MAKRLRSDSVNSTASPSWTIFTPPSEQVDVTDQDSSSASGQPKYVRLDPVGNEKTSLISCFLPPYCSGQSFTSHEQFETHYIQTHTNLCHECHRNFPSQRFLDLHIAENHDPLTELKRERGDKTYACFVEGCDRLCSTPQKRRMHLIDKHNFPKEYNWGIVKRGIDKCTSLLTRKRPSPRTSAEGETSTVEGKYKSRSANWAHRKASTGPSKANGRPIATAGATDGGPDQHLQEREGPKTVQPAKSKEVDMDDIASSMSSLKLVPTSIRFGRRGGGLRR